MSWATSLSISGLALSSEGVGGTVQGEGSQQQGGQRGGNRAGETKPVGKCHLSLSSLQLWFVSPPVSKTPIIPKTEVLPSIQCVTFAFPSTTDFC